MDKRLAAVRQVALALVLAVCVCGAAACAKPAGNGASDAATTEASGQSEATTTGEGADVAEQEPIEVPDGCLDRKGNLTVKALAELRGEQLLALLAQQEYAWNERNQLWTKLDGSAALVVLDAEDKPLGEEELANLGAGMVESSVSYRLVASNHSSAKRAFERLAGEVLEVEDVEHAEESSVGVLRDIEGQRCLVFVSTGNNVHAVNVYSEGAVAAGLFAEASGLDGAKDIDTAFELLAGRLPGAEDQ